MAWALGCYRVRQLNANGNQGVVDDTKWTTENVGDLIFYGALGGIVGGRLGYAFFYGYEKLVEDPLTLFRIWEGGMSFHGGVIGLLIGLWLFSRRTLKPFLSVADFAAPLVPLGIAAGRIGNFINGELWGRLSDAPWAMVFPNSEGLPRHPSQLYEVALEGFVLFALLWWFSSKPRPMGAVAGMFFVGYAVLRSAAEYFREPDAHIGFIAFDWLTMGQLLSIPMLIIGIILLWQAYSRK